MINWRSPLVKSILFHVTIFLLIILSGLGLFSRAKLDDAFIPIEVEIINIADKNNIPKAQVAASKPKPKPIKPAPPKPKPVVEPKKPEPKPEPQVEKPKEKPAEKPKEKPVETPKEKPKPEPQVDELESLLKTLEDEQQEQQEMAQTQQEYDPNQPLSVTEENAILSLITKQIQRCWNVPAGARNAQDLIVLVDVDISENGTLKFIGFSQGGSGGNYNDEFYRVAADSARRAILDPRCNPLRQLPTADRYNFWKELTLGFDPKKQIY
jgi:outer membrane biosynthesis protein TonB